MASLKQRINGWYAVWYQNGKQVCKSTGIEAKPKNKATAKAVADHMEAVAKGITTKDIAVAAIKATAKAFANDVEVPTIKDYLTNYKVGKAASSQRNYERAAQLFLNFLGPHETKDMDWLTEERCQSFINSMKGLREAGTIRTYKSILQAAFSKAVKKGIIEKNPFAAVETPKEENQRFKRQTFTQEEMQRLMKEPAYPWKEAVALSYYTGGQRLGDICNMTWQQVDFETQTIYMQTSKTGKRLSIPIITPLMRVLKSLHERNGGNRYVLPELQIKYTRSAGGASIEFTAMLTSMGIGEKLASPKSGRLQSSKSFHSIRHTTVTALRESEQISRDVAQEIVGHSSEMVQRAYSHPSRKKKEMALQLLEEAMTDKKQEEETATDNFIAALQKSDDPEQLLRALLEKIKRAH